MDNLSKKDVSLVLYHVSDMDGQCSAAIVEHAYRKGNSIIKGTPKYIPWLHSYNFNLEQYSQYNNVKQIIILDISLPPIKMKELIAAGIEIIWIDHHVSAIQESIEYKYSYLSGLREDTSNPDNKDSACALTWRYFFTMEQMPDIVRYCSDYDIWNRYKPEIDMINSALKSYNIFFCTSKQGTMYNNDSALLLDLLSDNSKIDGLLVAGKAIERYRIKQFIMLKNRMLSATFRGKTVLILNSSGGDGSRPFEGIKLPHDAVISFSMSSSGDWVFSMFAIDPTLDVSSIAVSYGGGGHKGAAGWVLKDPSIFFNECTDVCSVRNREREIYKNNQNQR